MMITPIEVKEIMTRLLNESWYIAGNKLPLSEYANQDWSSISLDDFILYSRGHGEIGSVKHQDPIIIYYLFKSFSPKTTLEIGRKKGLSTRLFAALAKPYGGKLYSIDGINSSGVQKKLDGLNLADNVVLIEAWSPWVTLPLEFEIDLLFIDGDHSYMSTLMDYHYFNYYLVKDGMVMFHDMRIPGVKDAVDTILERDRLKEVYRDGRISIYQKLIEKGQTYFQLQDTQRKKEAQRKIK